MGWVTFWAIFYKTRPVTLVVMYVALFVRGAETLQQLLVPK
jgi:hypothetical protein